MEDLIRIKANIAKVRTEILLSEQIDNLYNKEQVSDYINLAVAALNQAESFMNLTLKQS